MALFRVVFAFVVLGGVVCLPRRFLFQDRCTQDPETGHSHINHPDNGPTDYDVDMTCKNGTIYWNYPTGTIDLHFKGDHAFTVCFLDDLGADYLQFTDITRPGAPKMFPAFERDDPEKEYCVTSVNNILVVKMHAPQQTYMASLFYHLR
ncbi:uncharacterized protein LOC110464258 [Mizuhopecten yessoensis]|uniref:CUB domain-containing protein n=1 Tax=Mizuhopecten yessoensis TaxID=6573 RepID=A0A210R2A3_MIZYE|nr:uncharacterized protein LOC110464258 [Mizuhopecten yessoensis]OWF55072.1 hypothetical protein KP79_PYT17055 [Mizuhopecten yessoensis]